MNGWTAAIIAAAWLLIAAIVGPFIGRLLKHAQLRRDEQREIDQVPLGATRLPTNGRGRAHFLGKRRPR